MLLTNHSDIRNKLVGGLHKFIKLLVVQQSSTGDQPAYPYMTYAITSPYLSLGQPERYTEKVNGVYRQRNVEHYEQVYSFTVASKDEDEAMNYCLRAIQYFKFYGVQYLSDNHIAVVSVSNVSARDNMITIDYERRYGFDVRIRVACEEVNEDLSEIGVIEKANFNQK